MAEAAVKERLESALLELETRLTNVVRDLDVPAHRDWAEQAIEIEDDQALEHQAVLIEREILSVRRALARIDDGTYGTCIRCGESISKQRLEARPEAALCMRCAQAVAQRQNLAS